mmetsp:Transcript_2460/g.5856  ORF Transcript_2460/g.5856 Transcript_2460/m.5856 type:complete len:399 (+) Transcript_2460:151-1347(+)
MVDRMDTSAATFGQQMSHEKGTLVCLEQRKSQANNEWHTYTKEQNYTDFCFALPFGRLLSHAARQHNGPSPAHHDHHDQKHGFGPVHQSDLGQVFLADATNRRRSLPFLFRSTTTALFGVAARVAVFLCLVSFFPRKQELDRVPGRPGPGARHQFLVRRENKLHRQRLQEQQEDVPVGVPNEQQVLRRTGRCHRHHVGDYPGVEAEPPQGDARRRWSVVVAAEESQETHGPHLAEAHADGEDDEKEAERQTDELDETGGPVGANASLRDAHREDDGDGNHRLDDDCYHQQYTQKDAPREVVEFLVALFVALFVAVFVVVAIAIVFVLSVLVVPLSKGQKGRESVRVNDAVGLGGFSPFRKRLCRPRDGFWILRGGGGSSIGSFVSSAHRGMLCCATNR